MCLFFFFQAEDGIRDKLASGVRTCALPIYLHLDEDGHKVSVLFNRPIDVQEGFDLRTQFSGRIDFNRGGVVYKGPRPISARSEERRVGKECRSRWSPYQ